MSRCAAAGAFSAVSVLDLVAVDGLVVEVRKCKIAPSMVVLSPVVTRDWSADARTLVTVLWRSRRVDISVRSDSSGASAVSAGGGDCAFLFADVDVVVAEPGMEAGRE